MINDVKIFSYACWPSLCLLWKDIYSDPLLIYNWIVLLLHCMSSLCTLDINLYQICNLHSLPFNKSLFNFVDDFLCYAEGKFLSPTIDLLNQKLWIWSSVKCVLTNLLGDSDPL